MCGLVSLLLHAVCLSALIFGVVAMHVYVGVQLHFFYLFSRAQPPRPTPSTPTVMRHLYVICISVALTRVQDRQPVAFYPGSYPSPGAI